MVNVWLKFRLMSDEDFSTDRAETPDWNYFDCVDFAGSLIGVDLRSTLIFFSSERVPRCSP